MIEGHGGNIFEVAHRIGCRPEEILDFSSNLNPLGPPAELLTELKRRIDSVSSLPEVIPRKAAEAVAAFYDLHPENVLIGNGTTQFIFSLPPALDLRRALIVGPTYADYADACRMHRVEHFYQFSREIDEFESDIKRLAEKVPEVDAVYVCNPNNPTGRLIPAEKLTRLCDRHPSVRFIIDESYLPFVENGDKDSMLACRLQNVIVLHSFSKIFRIPGLRIGFVSAGSSTISAMKRYLIPWNVNSLALEAVCFLLQKFDRIQAFVPQTRKFIFQERNKLLETVHQQTDIRFLPSSTVFLLGKLPRGMQAAEIQQRLLADRILIRDCSNFEGLSSSYFRVSLKKAEANRFLAEKLIDSLSARG